MPGVQDKQSRKIEESHKLISKFSRRYRPYILFSGGRDSLATLHLVKEFSEKTDVLAIHVDSTISTPGNLEYIERTSRKLEVEIKIVHPKKDFFSLVEKWGFPTATRRWCCYHLKIEPLKLFFKNEPGPRVLFDGIRADESAQRKNYSVTGWQRHYESHVCHPIFRWSKEDVITYIRRHGLEENPLYDIFPRACDCWCPSFKSMSQFQSLKTHFPDFFERFVKAEKSLKGGGSALFKGGRKVYLQEL